MSQDYYERQEARQRYELRAERARQESDATARQAEKIASIIRWGSPFLWGITRKAGPPMPCPHRSDDGQGDQPRQAAYHEEKSQVYGAERHFFGCPGHWNGLKRSWRKEPMHG